MNYRRPIKIKKNHLLLQITRLDKTTFLEKERVKEDKSILKCNEELLVLDEGINSFICLVVFFLMSLLSLILCWGDKNGLLILFTPGVGLTLMSLVWTIFKPKQYIIFNRKEGTITYPGFLWSESVFTKFDDVVATISGGANTIGLKLWHPNLFTYRSISSPTIILAAQ